MAAVPPGAQVQAVVQNGTGNIPAGSTVTTAGSGGTASQTRTAGAAGTTTNNFDVGFDPPPLAITKTSSAGGTILPGQATTYTVTVTNHTGATQTGVHLVDVVPANTTYVPGTARVTTTAGNAIRVSEIYLDGAAPDQCSEAGTDFAGLTCTLTLPALVPNYFVIVQGSDGNGGTDTTPDEDYARLSADPFGNFGTTLGANQLRFTRGGDEVNWVGVITVVECVSPSCATDPNGFRLVDVVEVTHLNAGTTGTATTTPAWTDLGRVVLFGGANGSGCSTADNDGADHETCHVRLFPTGTNTINWTRDGTGGTETATSTVMAVQWGSAWTVQRVNVTGSNGGPGLNAAGEYNTAAISSVVRANTWVWGTGHTNDPDTGESAEGAIVTLGNGAAQNASETLVAVGTEEPESNVTVNFDVYTMTHPLLQVDYDFLLDGNAGSATVNVVTNTQTANRMALVYNGNDDDGTNYPLSIFSARYTTNGQITLERRRTGAEFPAWVQGIGFNAVAAGVSVTCLPVYPPAALNCTEPSTNSSVVDPVAGFTIAPGQSLVLTFQASVNAGVAGGTVITNLAIVDTDQEDPSQASAQDVVVVGAVTVEPNNAGFAAAGTFITFSHDVTNTGAVADSFVLTVTNDLLPWRIDLIDPDTGAIIATDLTGDGVWDVGGPVLSTGNMAPGAIRSYDVRATVPGGTPLGIQNTVRLNAVSTRSPAIADDAKDEITVISAFAPVVVTPDNSGLFGPGGTTSYAHYVVNRTGFFDTFDLYVASALSWPTTIYADTNGDGIFNPGVDLQVANTAFLAPNAAQLIFVVTTDPGSAPGTVDVAQITAASRLNPLLFGAATDTTTVVSNEVHDLSGGGTRLVTPNATATYPGTILNDQSVNDRFELSVSAAGLYGQDAFAHNTVLRVDTNGDGVPDTPIAEDTDGDGTWNTVNPAFDQDGDLRPDVAVPAGATLAYELVRTIDLLQVLERDFVTLTSRSMNAPSSDPDSVTATWVFAAVTRAGIRGVRVDRGGLVEFATGHQKDTSSFQLFETDDPRGLARLAALHDEPVRSPMPNSVRPILYRVRTRAVTKAYVVIVETETDGDRLRKGPFPVGDAVLAREVEALETRFDRMGVPRGDTRVVRGRRADDESRPRVDRDASRSRTHVEGAGVPAAPALKIEVEGAGVVRVPASQLGALGSSPRPRRMRLYNLGDEVPFRVEADGSSWALVFTARALSTDYTSRNAYVLTAAVAPPPYGLETRLTRTGDGAWPGFRRVERNLLYVPTGPDGADPWVWDYVGVGSWPVVEVDPAAGDFDLPGFVASAEAVPVRLRLAGQSPHSHTVDAALNGVHVGSVTFDGTGRALLTGVFPADHLRETGNQLTLQYSSAPLPGTTPVDDGFVSIDHLDLGEWPTPPSQPLTPAAVLPYDGTLPALAGVQYLIVTHPLFRGEAERLAGLKAAEGLATAIVDTETAYDRFAAGVQDAGAVRALVRHARRESGLLRFVLLLGDDTFDPRDFTGSGLPAFVPSLFVRDQSFGWIPSENAYADTDDDGKPDLAIGRLPAQTPAEADLLVDKVESQAAVLAPYAGRHVFVADNAGEEDADFPEEAESALGLLRRGQTAALVSVGSDVTQARAALDASWQGGVMLSHYFGHGGFNQWADESLLTNALVTGSGGAWRAGVVLSWACLAQWYVDIYGRTVNEEMLFAPGGAVASFGPSGISAPAGHRVLFDKTYRALYVPGATLGEAIMMGKRQALEERPTLTDVVHGFNLLGDPALSLPPTPAQH